MLSFLQPAKDLWLAAFGARICYSSKPPTELFADPKVTVPEQRVKFLRNLMELGHYSVFAPVPLILDFNHPLVREWVEILLFEIGAPKVHIFNRKTVYLTLRHLVESIHNPEFRIAMPDRLFNELSKWLSEIFELSLHYPAPEKPVGEEKDVYLIYKNKNWNVVVWTNVSRVTTHQLVRHCACNFLQRSNRYTKVGELVIPESVELTFGKQEIEEFKRQVTGLYNRLLEQGVKKEDARYLYPHGVTSTILIAGTNKWCWRPLIKARAENTHAQWEIREFTSRTARLLPGI
jgi:thymidylate synthase (FAD)